LIAQCYKPERGHLFATLKPLEAPVACPDQVSQIIWLMFSGVVQSDTSNHLSLPPVYNPSADLGTNPQLRRDCEVKYLDKNRIWLSHIRFTNDGTMNTYSNGTNTTKRYEPPYDEGFLEAQFETTSVTNWDGFDVPLQVIGRILAPNSDGFFRTNSTIEITVASIGVLAADVELPPPPAANTDIFDSRTPIAPNQMVGFKVADRKWPSLEQSQAALEKAKREREKPKRYP